MADTFKPSQWVKNEYSARVGELIAEFCQVYQSSLSLERFTLEDLKKEPQSTFYAAIRYVYSNTFEQDNSILKDTKNYYKTSINQYTSSNYNAYDYEILDDILDVLINYCELLNKIPDQKSYSLITGINRVTLYRWVNKYKYSSINNNINNSVSIDNNNSLNTLCSNLIIKLLIDKKESLEARAYDGKTNPTGAAIVLNNEFYNVQTVQDDSQNQQRLEANDLAGLLADIKSE